VTEAWIEYLTVFVGSLITIVSPENRNPINGNREASNVAEGDNNVKIRAKSKTATKIAGVICLKSPKAVIRNSAIIYGRKGTDM
jgi:hypothetical protein